MTPSPFSSVAPTTPLIRTPSVSVSPTLMLNPTETDWTQFVPDLIVGVITGLIVGLFILLVQRTAESRSLRRQCESQFLMFAERAASFLWQSDIVNIRDARAEPTGPAAVLQAARTEPVWFWHRYVKAYVRQVHDLDSFLDQCREFETAANRLHAELRHETRLYNAKLGLIEANDYLDYQHYIGRNFWASTVDLLPHLDADERLVARLETSFVHLSDNEHLYELTKEWARARSAVVTAGDFLRTSFEAALSGVKERFVIIGSGGGRVGRGG